MKTTVKKDTCIGCGACTVIANNVFQIGDDGLAEVINPIEDNNKNEQRVQKVEEADFENVIDASESCPTSAIEVIENEENE